MLFAVRFFVICPWLVALTWFGFSPRCLAADYTVSSSGGSIVVTDATGAGQPLVISQPATNTIRFTATGLTFSVNGGANTTDSAELSLAGIQGITVNGGSGYDAINVESFGSTAFPSLTINGGAGYESVNFQGDITFAANRSLVVDLQSDGATPDADQITFERNANLILSATGAATCKAGGAFQMNEGSSLVTNHGNLLVEANQQTIATEGGHSGVFLFTGLLQATGSGTVTVRGRGGSYGVRLHNGGRIAGGTSGLVSVTGIGGSNWENGNEGILISGGGAAVTSAGGHIILTGIGGGAGAGGENTGVHVFDGTVSAGGGGNVTIRSTAGGGAGSYAFYASALDSTIISANNGVVEITGIPGPLNEGFVWIVSGAVVATGNNQPVTLTADRMFIGNPVTAGAGRVTLRPYTSGRPIVLGDSSTIVLDLSDFYLDFITAGEIQVGDSASGPVTVGAAITRPSSTNMYLVSAGDVLFSGNGRIDTAGGTLSLDAGNPPFAVKPQKSGTDVTSSTLTLDSTLSLRINGATADADYDQLHVAGGVNLAAAAALDISNTMYPGALGNSFTLIANDGTHPITGIFTGLPEGAFVKWPGDAALVGRLTYSGDTGNDAVLTLVPPDPGFAIVTSTSDSGPGSLRNALTYAASRAGSDTITFDPTLDGHIVTLSSGIIIYDPGGVIIDALSLPAGLTVKSGFAGNDRIFTIATTVALHGLTLTGGKGGDAQLGGALYNLGALTMTRCTLRGNSAASGGAIFTLGGLSLTDCTFFGNTATAGSGGALDVGLSGNTTLTRCTFSGNSAAVYGGAIGASSNLMLTHCTISGNLAGSGGGIKAGARSLQAADAVGVFLTHCIVAQNTATIAAPDISPGPNASILLLGGTLTGDANLAPLGDYGGFTQTIALPPGSPARNAATGSSNPIDQRGLPVIGIPDLGAYESGHDTNCAAWLWENLPAAATVDQHNTNFDYDGDGATNEQEWNARTNPSDHASVFRITSIAGIGSQHIIGFPTETGRTYTLWRSHDATEWTGDPDAPTLNGNGGPQFFTVPVPDVPLSSSNGRRFYRIHAGP